jgi:PPOX class probable F420-dependent enzyme
MPEPPLPRELAEFLLQPNPAAIGTVRPDGRPHTTATWYVWDDGYVYVNMDASRRRLEHMRRDPHVSITALGADDWYRHVTLTGRVVAIDDDADFENADRFSRHYTGEPYPRRDQHRIAARIEVDSWHAWIQGQPWNGSE